MFACELDGQIFLGDAIGMLMLYVVYIVVVLLGRRIFQKQKVKLFEGAL